MERILAQYRKNCLQANKFFDASAKVVHPDKNNKERLSAHTDSADELKGGEITEYESSTLDYIGWYALHHASNRIGVNPVIDLPSTTPRSGSLIALMEKN